MKIYMKKDRLGVDAVGTYNPETKECIVLKGSKVSETISRAPTFRGAKSIIRSRERTVENCIVMKDVVFKSCSTAGNYVTGRSTDGFSTWKVNNDQTLREFLASEN